MKVRGIKELRSALKSVDENLAKELTLGLARIADHVAGRARPKVPVRTGAAAASIKVRKKAAAATLAVGGTSAEYYPWLDFGGRVGRNDSAVRPFIPEGRFLFPALRESEAEVKQMIEDLFAHLKAAGGF